MNSTMLHSMRAAGAAALLAAGLSAQAATPVEPNVPHKPVNTTSTGRELTGPGTQPEEYSAGSAQEGTSGASGRTGATAAPVTGGTPVKPGVPHKPSNTTSTGRELTGPGAQPGEYNAAGSKPAAKFDTVHNVRVAPDTTTPTGRAWRDSVRGGGGATRP